MLAHTLSETASGPARHLRQARALLGAPRDTARQAITLAAGLSSLRGLLGASTARSLNGPLRAERQWVQARGSLADVKTIRRALGGTVNDVLLAAVSGGFRALLQDVANPYPRADRAHARAALAAHTKRPRDSRQPRLGAVRRAARRPAGPRRAAARDHDQLDALKRSGQAVAGSALTQLSGLAPPPLVALGARALTACLNIACRPSPPTFPAPSSRSTCAAGGCSRTSPYVPLALDVRIGVAICSYDGTLGFGITGDGKHATDIPTLADGIEHELAQLLERATPTRPPGPRAPRAQVDPRRGPFADRLTRSRAPRPRS